ncbi:glycosyltransferase [Mycobacterium rhizamassiliense]|uniref:Glycosyltransferase n=1 Tax=Mycobacterium rhizamassiliense TaxID=1841860 RepID=A0A2U3P024_9MYCO|nr:glycosyltransferase [Mycobacterium rhizamassiliense]SPM37100.1 glycosyltransferase [Mycobacterium rhizamassiliense]
MKFVIASYGTRGDIEPSIAVGRELMRRGHDVCMAVPPDLVWFVESAGLTGAAYGEDTQAWLDAHRNFWTSFLRNFWRVGRAAGLLHEVWELATMCWESASSALVSLAEGADVLVTGLGYQEPAANVAEFYDIPLATLHYFPARANGQLVRPLPPFMGRAAMKVLDWTQWRLLKRVEDAQRRELGLPKAKSAASRRIAQRGSLEIQAYQELCFPGLADEWAKWEDRRPFVGGLTMEFATDADDEVASWIAAGTSPIYFGFGSMPVQSPADTVGMISAACARLGERALICAGWSDFSDIPVSDHVKVVGSVNHAAIFPTCRAVVHHGGAGTTAASLRAGVPTLVLSMLGDQPIWGAQVKRLKVGTSRRFSTTTEDTLVADLRQILAPEVAIRAREIATEMTKPAESVADTADLLEKFARER